MSCQATCLCLVRINAPVLAYHPSLGLRLEQLEPGPYGKLALQCTPNLLISQEFDGFIYVRN